MQYIIGVDDTDNLESRGTGSLARSMAAALSKDFVVHGVTRHQLLEDERVPKTAKNSCAGILFEGVAYPLEDIAMFARKIMLDDFQPGSDPGLCIAKAVPEAVISYGGRVKRELVNQAQARELAAAHGLYLEGLGGDEDGVIGALAAVGLAAEGNDGRYVMVGSIRDLEGLQPVSAVQKAGVTAVLTLDGRPVMEGLVQADKLRPARRNNQPLLFVQQEGDHWMSLKLD